MKVKRSQTILKSHIGQVFLVHNGLTEKPVKITPLHLSFKFGEFVPTRKRPVHKKKSKKK